LVLKSYILLHDALPCRLAQRKLGFNKILLFCKPIPKQAACDAAS
jgi:hypothetical protein